MSLISNFFVLSPRGDTILSKMYRVGSPSVVAHERSHTEAFLRKVRFWDGMTQFSGGAAAVSSPEFVSTPTFSGNPTLSAAPSMEGSEGMGLGMGMMDTGLGCGEEGGGVGKKRDAPPVFLMPDGLNYLHIKRNGLIFACSSPTNVSPCTVLEVGTFI